MRLRLNVYMIMFFSLFATVLNPAFAPASNRETPVVKAVRKVSPAVVNINSEYVVRQRVGPFSGLGMDSFFDSFFRDFFDPGFEQRFKRTSLGSGVIIDGDRGLILTNEHVIAKASAISVVLQDAREFKAQVVGADPDSDLAVLRINGADPLPAVAMGDSDDLMIGETIIAIGNPFGFSHTVTTGVVSALDRSLRTDDRVFHHFIQTDASINPGNSGGPLLNIDGDLIGINTAIYAKAQGIGFAIPINKARRIVADLIQYGEVIQGWVGIVVQALDPRIADYMNLKVKKGVLVQAVEPESPADHAGVREGDVIFALNGKRLLAPSDYFSFIRDYAAGDTISLEIFRDGSQKKVDLKTMLFPEERAMTLAAQLLGIEVEDLSRQNRRRYRFLAEDGVVITHLDKRSSLARIGAKPGDVLRQIEDQRVENLSDFKKAIIKYRQKSSWVLLLQRGDRGYYITVKQ